MTSGSTTFRPLMLALLTAACVPDVAEDPMTERDEEIEDTTDEQSDLDAAPAVEPARAPCIGGSAALEDPTTKHCYVYVSTPSTWSQARAICASLTPTMDLVEINDAAENSFVQMLPPPTIPDVWTGGNDQANEGTFLWAAGAPMTYTNWRTGEPNNGAGGLPENCMVTEIDNLGTWDDRSCEVPYPYVCERAAAPL